MHSRVPTQGQAADNHGLIHVASLTQLQSDLRSLCVESRRRHPALKEEAEMAVRKVRGLQGASSAGIRSTEFRAIIQPFELACDTADAKLQLIAVNCLQKCISTNAAPPDLVHQLLETIYRLTEDGAKSTRASDSGELVLAKALQTLLALLASSRYTIRCADVGRALSCCFLHAGSGLSPSSVTQNTALATLRQSIAMLAGRAAMSSADEETDVAQEGIADTDCALRCVSLLLKDLCVYAASDDDGHYTSEHPTWIRVYCVEKQFLLELIELALVAAPKLFAGDSSLLLILRKELCPLLSNILSEASLSFKTLFHAVRIIWAFATHLEAVLRREYAPLLKKLIDLLPVRAAESPSQLPGNFKNVTPLWQRTLVMELFSLIFADHKMVRGWHAYDCGSQSESTYANLIRTLLAVVEYGLLGDKVFPSPPGSLRRVSLETAAEAAPNDSAGYVLSLAIGSMIDVGTAISEHFELGQSDTSQANIVDATWMPLLQMLALVLLRCNHTDMVRAVLQVYRRLAKVTILGGMTLLVARDAVLSSLARFCLTRSDCDYLRVDVKLNSAPDMQGSTTNTGTASSPRLLLKNVAVIVAFFDCVHDHLFGEMLCTPPWAMLFELLEDIDRALRICPNSDSSQKRTDSLLSEEHVHNISTATSRFFADSAALSNCQLSDMVDAAGVLLTHKLTSDAPDVDGSTRLSNGATDLSACCFLVSSLTSIFKYNLERVWCSWDAMVDVLQLVARSTDHYLASEGASALLDVVTHALPQEDDQQRVLEPLALLSKSTCEEANERMLRGLYTLIESAGHDFRTGWESVFAIIQHGSNSSASKVVNAAFELMQLIVTDFLPCMPEEFIQPCILTVSQFRTRHCSINISLTAIGQLWHIADWVGGVQQSLIAAFESIVNSGRDPVPKIVNDVSTLDGGAMTPSDGGAPLFVVPAPPERTSPSVHIDRLWRTIFHQMQRGTDDPRPEVRKCAVQTLFSTLVTHGILFSDLQWHEYLWQLVFPVVAAIHAASLAARNAAIADDCTESVVSGSGQRQIVPMLIHHSRNTLSKQWDETKVLALAGAIRVFCEYLASIITLDSFGVAWKLLLEFSEASLLLGSEEVVLAGIDALGDLIAVCCSDAADQPDNLGIHMRDDSHRSGSLSLLNGTSSTTDGNAACDLLLRQFSSKDVWSPLVEMLYDAVVQLTEGPVEGPSPSRRHSWVLMPAEPVLSSKSLHRLVECMTRVNVSSWTDDVNLSEYAKQRFFTYAASIELLVHASLRFEQPMQVFSSAEHAGPERALRGLQPAQDFALGWMKRQLEFWDTTDATSMRVTAGGLGLVNPSSEPVAEGTTLLLLQCLRYLPHGAEVIAKCGGHSMLSHAIPTVCGPGHCFPLAHAALNLILQFFRPKCGEYEVRVARHSKIVDDASVFLLAVRILGQCAEISAGKESPADEFANFRSACRQAVMQLVRRGFAANATAVARRQTMVGRASECSSAELELICQELATLGGRYLAPERNPDYTQELDTDVEIADCIVAALRCPSFDQGRPALAEGTVSRLLRVLDTGAAQHHSPMEPHGHTIAFKEALASKCFAALFELGEPRDLGGGLVPRLVAPILFTRCEAILRNYLSYYRDAGISCLPAPRWQREELLRLLCALSKLPSGRVSGSTCVTGEVECGWHHLLVRLLPRLCEVIALGATTNGQVQAQLAHLISVGFASLGLEP